jgi:hypothetical protein
MSIERFGAYEGAGLVKLSVCRFGPLGLLDEDHFWAKATEACRQLLQHEAKEAQ